ncbi:MAG: TadE/TadG family type IV pilus assembly protein [Pseudomonadota bacterium]|uniref:TadE/TadG family type IV pilus assembly protein n=1 Tax=Phenylobacterium sp. TaxID=1871053 RepID=UPI0025D45ECA|nr:TadE/TadG family type IV pilus assembly protein [Phenylobacterium sp.]MBT9473294.1 pilus assembly protein [Phenylobacterium sp.]
MHIARFLRDRRGSAAVEFALVVPIMLVLYYGMVEATQALLVNRRVSFIATGVGDLTTQAAQLSKTQLQDIFKISTAVMKPFPTDTLAIRVASIETDAQGVPTKKWEEVSKAFSYPVDLTTVTKEPSTAIIRAETVYTFNSPLKKLMPNALVFKHKMDLKPRAGVPVVLLPN